MDACIYCKGTTEAHCGNRTCEWKQCTECGTVLWASASRAMRQGRSVQWPYTTPE